MFFQKWSALLVSPDSPSPTVQVLKPKQPKRKELKVRNMWFLFFIFFNEPIDGTQSLDSLFPGLLIEDDTINRIQVKRFGQVYFKALHKINWERSIIVIWMSSAHKDSINPKKGLKSFVPLLVQLCTNICYDSVHSDDVKDCFSAKSFPVSILTGNELCFSTHSPDEDGIMNLHNKYGECRVFPASV